MSLGSRTGLVNFQMRVSGVNTVDQSATCSPGQQSGFASKVPALIQNCCISWWLGNIPFSTEQGLDLLKCLEPKDVSQRVAVSNLTKRPDEARCLRTGTPRPLTRSKDYFAVDSDQISCCFQHQKQQALLTR